MTCILGCDPGSSGALAFYFTEAPTRIAVEDMPVVGKDVDAVTLCQRIEQMRPDMAVVEAVHSMPGQGVASMFRMGVSYGTLCGVLLACKVPLHLVTPNKWKNYYRLDADKEKSRARALLLFPTSDGFARKKDHGRAEAALIAKYGADVILRGE